MQYDHYAPSTGLDLKPFIGTVVTSLYEWKAIEKDNEQQ